MSIQSPVAPSTSARAGTALVQALGATSSRPITWYVDRQVAEGRWRQETIPADVLGLSRSLNVFRAARRTNLITHQWFGDEHTFCPPTWWDLAIGSGACGLRCRACFLMLTHRIRRDPTRHLLYDNVEDFIHAAEKWLAHPKRSCQQTLGVGIDRSDSLLYEGVTGYVRQLAPLFGDPSRNPHRCRLLLLTKSQNAHFLADVAPQHRDAVVVSFSLNPEPIADLWEGKWPDGSRVTPSITSRLEAARVAQDLGFEIRMRLDPILTPPGWLSHYRDFVSQIKSLRLDFALWTLGTYREKNAQLDAWRTRWGLPPVEWWSDEEQLIKNGTHWHIPEARRREIYTLVHQVVNSEFSGAKVGLCKETHTMRKAIGLCRTGCNCLV